MKRTVTIVALLFAACALAFGQNRVCRGVVMNIGGTELCSENDPNATFSPPDASRVKSFSAFSTGGRSAAAPQCGNVTLYGPHVAVGKQAGGEWFTILNFINNSPTGKAIDNTFFTTTSSRLQTHITFSNGAEVEETEGSTSLQGRSSVTLTLSYCRDNTFGLCGSDGVKTGWTRLTTTSTWVDRVQDCVPDIEVSVTFQLRNSSGLVFGSVGLPFVSADTWQIMYAVSTQNAVVGLAIANPNISAVTVALQLFVNGTSQPFATTSFVLNPGNQTSALLGDFFRNVPGWTGTLVDGHLEVISNAPPVVVLALRADRSTDGNSFTLSGIPVFPGKDQ